MAEILKKEGFLENVPQKRTTRSQSKKEEEEKQQPDQDEDEDLKELENQLIQVTDHYQRDTTGSFDLILVRLNKL